jgi:type II secretory pathway pseudopilin PulG
MLMYDAVAPLGPELIIVLTLTFAIVLAAILIVGIRRRRKTGRLRAELHRMSARITALELAENRHLLMRVKSIPLVPEHVAETTLAPLAIAPSSEGRDLEAR